MKFSFFCPLYGLRRRGQRLGDMSTKSWVIFFTPSLLCSGKIIYGFITIQLLFMQSLLKVTGDSKFYFFVGLPPSVQDFFFIKHVTLNARVSGYLDLKFHNLSPFCIFPIDFEDFFIKKRTNCEIFNVNNRRSSAFKGTCYITKKSCTDGGNPTKKCNFWVTRHFREELHK